MREGWIGVRLETSLIGLPISNRALKVVVIVMVCDGDGEGWC